MTRQMTLEPRYVEFVPDQLQSGVLYISRRYSTAIHLCCCGCTREVVTPLTPTDWQLTTQGNAVTLFPSIGSWNSPCQSHYWIRRNRVQWAPAWTRQEIESGRRRDRLAKDLYYRQPSPTVTTAPRTESGSTASAAASVWSRFVKWLLG